MSYDMIDRFLRNNLGDDDYAEYSEALDSLCVPTKREWVGLTQRELDDLWMLHHDDYGYQTSADGYERAIEAKLKEKNT